MSNKVKRDSPLVRTVLSLDNHLSELERVGGKINSTDMTSDVDVEFIQKLMNRFTECAQGVSEEVANLSTQLLEARARAEGIAQGVSSQAERFSERRTEQNEKLERFRALGERVRELNDGIRQCRDDPQKLSSSLPAFEADLALIIEDLQSLRTSARESRMRGLEKNAESLEQSLQAVRKKLSGMGSR